MHTTIDVDVLDHDEVPTGQSVPVELSYIVIRENYGEDADGLRATTLVSYEILDHYIDPVHLA